MFLWPPREDFNEPRGKRQSEGEGSNHKKQRVGAVHEDPVDQKDQNGDTALDQIVKNVTGNPDEATLCTLSTLLRYSKVIEPETKDGLGRILCLAVESGPIEPTKQFIKSLVHVMDTTGLLEILKNTQRPWWNRPILDNHIHITSYITQVIRVLQGKRDVDKLVLICQNVCPNSKVHENEVNDVMSTMVPMVLIMIDDVDQTAATVTKSHCPVATP